MKENTTDLIASLFMNVSRLMKHKLDLNSPLYQLPIAQVEVLRFIGERGRVSMKDISDFLSITPPSATVLVNKLVKMDFAARHYSATDRRAVHLELTTKGAGALRKGIEQRCKIFTKLLNNLNQKEQAELLQTLQKMVIEQSPA